MSKDPAGTELTYNLRWFLLPELDFKPTIQMTALGNARDALRSRLVCLIYRFEGQDTVEARKARDEVRSKLGAMGFFSGKLNKPTKAKMEKDVAGPKSQLVAVAENAPKISVFVYTDPTPPSSKKKATVEECLDMGSNLDCVLCVARAVAQELARETKGVALEIDNQAGIDQFWQRLDRVTKGRQIERLYLFGHGWDGGMKIGAGDLKLGMPIPMSFQGCRFAKNAEIWFFGCRVGGGLPWNVEKLFKEFGARLLWFRGGIVKGYDVLVTSQCGNGRFTLTLPGNGSISIPPHRPAQTPTPPLLPFPDPPVKISIPACDPGQTMKDFLKLLEDFAKNKEKVD